MRNRATTPLKRMKIRQSWSKFNLYNLSRLRNPPTANRTFFQQKWTAKSMARAYHGEQVREGQWTRMFTRRIRSVVPMNPQQLARDDGSKESAGRGSGLQPNPHSRRSSSTPPRMPFSQMTFAPLERRLDVAIFRALFASSTRQARQFVVHGAVTVNGKKMKYPGYLLNPGDLFQVDPERVMFATGAPKEKAERRAGRLARNNSTESERKDPDITEDGSGPASEADSKEDPKETLKSLMSQAKTILSRDKAVLPAKRKQELRGFQKAIRSVLSRSASSKILTDNLESQFSELISLLNIQKTEKSVAEKAKSGAEKEANSTLTSSEQVAGEGEKAKVDTSADGVSNQLKEAFQKAVDNSGALDEASMSELTEDELGILKRAVELMRDNPIDSSKPYATPWRPRNFMSAFAFIPRYLEVNQNICAAVYLRHPVVRPGFAEVPSPFGESIGTAAFTWYLRRR